MNGHMYFLYYERANGMIRVFIPYHYEWAQVVLIWKWGNIIDLEKDDHEFHTSQMEKA